MTDRIEDKLRLIIADAESDAANLDGMPLSGLVLGANFGNLYAMVKALAQFQLDHLEGQRTTG